MRFLRYNMVGLMGIGVKFSILAALVEWVHLGYLMATVIALETTILHNFSWHLCWTWGDRSAHIPFSGILVRLLRFQTANGAVGFAANLIVMRALVDGLGIHYFIANMVATVVAGLASFLLSEFFVFANPSSVSRPPFPALADQASTGNS
jgi:putative flippase GtrA